MELECIDFDLSYAVESVVVAHASRAEAKGLELIASVHPEVPLLLRGDPGRLQQVLTNLITNAIKFTEVGEIAIRATLEEQSDQEAYIRFSINDTGIGIPRHRVDRLFESFLQVDPSTTRKYGGTGLGLAICKRLVESMGGEIGVLSEEGRGSTFWFLVRFHKQPATAGGGQALSGDIRDTRILVVDDNATNREVLQEQLRAAGLPHVAAPDAASALMALREAASAGDPFGMAVLDMHMPGMDGGELAKVIKADPLLRNTILILLSSVLADERQLRAAGFAACLMKPIRPALLLDALSGAWASTTTPVEFASVQERAPQADSRCNVTHPAARILLAEDHAISQEIAVTILRQAGYVCDAVTDGTKAVEAALAREYDLVLMDCQMPELDGFSAAKIIREAEQDGRLALRNGRRLPIIALTANAVRGDRERCLDAGMDDYLSKPLNSKKLLEVVESQLAKREPAERRISYSTEPGDDVRADRSEIPFDFESLLQRLDGDHDYCVSLVTRFQE